MRFNNSRSKGISIDSDKKNKANLGQKHRGAKFCNGWRWREQARFCLRAVCWRGPLSGAVTGRIDVHSHTVPPFYTKVMEKEILATGHPLPTWTPSLHIEIMDKNGIATSVVSPMTRAAQDSLSDKSERRANWRGRRTTTRNSL